MIQAQQNRFILIEIEKKSTKKQLWIDFFCENAAWTNLASETEIAWKPISDATKKWKKDWNFPWKRCSNFEKKVLELPVRILCEIKTTPQSLNQHLRIHLFPVKTFQKVLELPVRILREIKNDAENPWTTSPNPSFTPKVLEPTSPNPSFSRENSTAILKKFQPR